MPLSPRTKIKPTKSDQMHHVDELGNFGFQKVAIWQTAPGCLAYTLTNDKPETKAIFSTPKALYAFCCQNEVRYIGRTTKSLSKRFVGYCKPGNTQATNRRCHEKILKCLESGEVEIHALTFSPHFEYRGIAIDFASGLEQGLIDFFTPPWNATIKGGRAKTESEALEEEASAPTAPAPATPPQDTASLADFTIKLRKTYFEKGFINPPANVASQFGERGEVILIRLEGEELPVSTTIQHVSASYAAPRIMGGACVASWFQKHFALDDDVRIKIVSRNEIFVMLPK